MMKNLLKDKEKSSLNNLKQKKKLMNEIDVEKSSLQGDQNLEGKLQFLVDFAIIFLLFC